MKLSNFLVTFKVQPTLTSSPTARRQQSNRTTNRIDSTNAGPRREINRSSSETTETDDAGKSSLASKPSDTSMRRETVHHDDSAVSSGVAATDLAHKLVKTPPRKRLGTVGGLKKINEKNDREDQRQQRSQDVTPSKKAYESDFSQLPQPGGIEDEACKHKENSARSSMAHGRLGQIGGLKESMSPKKAARRDKMEFSPGTKQIHGRLGTIGGTQSPTISHTGPPAPPEVLSTPRLVDKADQSQHKDGLHSSPEIADQRREELKRQINEKSNAPIKKSRRF